MGGGALVGNRRRLNREPEIERTRGGCRERREKRRKMDERRGGRKKMRRTNTHTGQQQQQTGKKKKRVEKKEGKQTRLDICIFGCFLFCFYFSLFLRRGVVCCSSTLKKPGGFFFFAQTHAHRKNKFTHESFV
jgi:hypothetical protein